MTKRATKILVTGANGFIGKALLSVLVQQGYEVIAAVRNLSSQKEFSTSMIAVGNIDQKTDWTKALKGVHIVIHLAARVHIMAERSAEALSLYRQVNVLGTLNLAQQAIKAGVTRFIFASTIKVLGEERSKPYTHQDIAAPADAYALSKWEAEQGLQQLSQQYNLEVIILRFPLVYGAGVKANFLRLIKWVDKGVPLPFGAINNKRSLVYLGNLVDAITVCCQHYKASGKVFLISDGVDLSTTELIQRLAYHLQVKARLFSIDPWLIDNILTLLGKKSEARRLLGSLTVDNSYLCSVLNWQVPYSIDEGLANTISDYKNS